MKSFNYIYIAILISIFTGCGGGNTSIGSASTSVRTEPVDFIDTENSNFQDGSDSLDFFFSWDQDIFSGYSRMADLLGYKQKVFKSERILIESYKPNKNGENFIRVFHNNHGSSSGDFVTFGKLNSLNLKINEALKDKEFEILNVNLNSYLIKASNDLTIINFPLLVPELIYKNKECEGIQKMTQYPPDLNAGSVKFNSRDAIKTKTVVVTNLNGCSPSNSIFTTYKYFTNGSAYNGNNFKYSFLGSSIINGDYSFIDDDFKFPVSFKHGDSGVLATTTNYTDVSRRVKQGRTIIKYDVLRNAKTGWLIILITSDTFNSNGTRTVSILDYYERYETYAGSKYGLSKTIAKYNNTHKNEMNIYYFPRVFNSKEGSSFSGTGAISGAPNDIRNWKFIPIDVTDYVEEGKIEILLKVGNGKASASFDLLDNKVPALSVDEKPLNSLSKSYDIAPGLTTTLSYNFPRLASKIYYLGVRAGGPNSSDNANTFQYEILVKN
jgi:hypothetical protein